MNLQKFNSKRYALAVFMSISLLISSFLSMDARAAISFETLKTKAAEWRNNNKVYNVKEAAKVLGMPDYTPESLNNEDKKIRALARTQNATLTIFQKLVEQPHIKSAISDHITNNSFSEFKKSSPSRFVNNQLTSYNYYSSKKHYEDLKSDTLQERRIAKNNLVILEGYIKMIQQVAFAEINKGITQIKKTPKNDKKNANAWERSTTNIPNISEVFNSPQVRNKIAKTYQELKGKQRETEQKQLEDENSEDQSSWNDSDEAPLSPSAFSPTIASSNLTQQSNREEDWGKLQKSWRNKKPVTIEYDTERVESTIQSTSSKQEIEKELQKDLKKALRKLYVAANDSDEEDSWDDETNTSDTSKDEEKPQPGKLNISEFNKQFSHLFSGGITQREEIRDKFTGNGASTSNTTNSHKTKVKDLNEFGYYSQIENDKANDLPPPPTPKELEQINIEHQEAVYQRQGQEAEHQFQEEAERQGLGGEAESFPPPPTEEELEEMQRQTEEQECQRLGGEAENFPPLPTEEELEELQMQAEEQEHQRLLTDEERKQQEEAEKQKAKEISDDTNINEEDSDEDYESEVEVQPEDTEAIDVLTESKLLEEDNSIMA